MAGILLATTAGAAGASGGTSTNPAPGTPGYVARDVHNMADAYGRETGPNGQLSNPRYLPSLIAADTPTYANDLLSQAARPGRPALTPGLLVPGWNIGNPLRDSWDGTRGTITPVAFPNRYGAQLIGDVFTPKDGATDPYTHQPLHGPYPGVVITPGSVQGSERMYWWLAEDLAERGYVVLVYDTQGQGRSETFPHAGPLPDVPFCDPLEPPQTYEETGCPGVPSQQAANFVVGTEDATSFLLSMPDHPYQGTVNPRWQLLDHSPDPHPVTPGRTSRVAIIGHSMGALAVSYVQGEDPRVATAVALDKLSASSAAIAGGSSGGASAAGATLPPSRPVVPSLGIQSEYGFSVQPYVMSGGSSLAPTPIPPNQAPDPKREEKTGFDAWRAAGVDTMLVVPRASTHLEYTDIPYVLPASRYGQDLASYYVQAWLDKYLEHDPSADNRLFADTFTYLEPVGDGRWTPVTLHRPDALSYQFCSGYALHRGSSLVTSVDWNGVGCP